jgi:hypothetical protein
MTKAKTWMDCSRYVSCLLNIHLPCHPNLQNLLFYCLTLHSDKIFYYSHFQLGKHVILAIGIRTKLCLGFLVFVFIIKEIKYLTSHIVLLVARNTDLRWAIFQQWGQPWFWEPCDQGHQTWKEETGALVLGKLVTVIALITSLLTIILEN